MTVRDLAKLLDWHQISGAPVVDAAGKVVGVVSATDLVRLAAEEPEAAPAIEATDFELPPEEADDEEAWFYLLSREAEALHGRSPADLSSAAYDEVTVRDIMMPAIFSVRPDATIAELARGSAPDAATVTAIRVEPAG